MPGRGRTQGSKRGMPCSEDQGGRADLSQSQEMDTEPEKEILDSEVEVMDNRNEIEGHESDELEKLRLQIRLAEIDSRNKEKEMETQIRLAEIELERDRLRSDSRTSNSSELGGNLDSLARKLRWALPKMPDKEAEVPSWFRAVEVVLQTYDVPEELRGQLVLTVLSEKCKTALNRLTADEIRDYQTLKQFLLDELRLSAAEYLKEFTSAEKGSKETWPQFAARMEDLYRYYLNSRGVDSFEQLTKLVVSDHLCYDGQAYRQKRGVPMGSPISGILCELVVRKLEKSVLFDFRKDIVYFKRYVDDIFILWKNNRKINEFIEGINRNNDGLKLKLEQKSSVTIHFLDINIQFKNGHLSTSVYVKPTHSPLYIPLQSNDPYHYKMAAFRALIRRAFLYCDNVMDRAKEINRILLVAETLGYRKSAITGMVKRYEKNVARGSKQRPAKITKFTYNRYAKSIMKEIANRNETSIILKRAPNLYMILRNDKDSIRKEEKAGVYRIPYENAQLGIKKDYIGVTTRSLSVRLKEHKYNIRKSSNATVLSQMAQTESSIVKWDEADIIKPVSSPTLARTAEKIEIYKSKLEGACINARDAEGLGHILPSAWKYMVKNSARNS
ncbi:uncharacterized protein [Centruroides vittatus]|uniref:uncharacterized protein n=1 Tax=Centruroides vittatus TaxID=120091 RepID=UPI003510B8DD